jgi:hypothetical protein
MAQSWRAEEGIAGNGLNTAPRTDDSESAERIEPRYPATLDLAEVNRFAVRESRERWGGQFRPTIAPMIDGLHLAGLFR